MRSGEMFGKLQETYAEENAMEKHGLFYNCPYFIEEILHRVLKQRFLRPIIWMRKLCLWLRRMIQ